MLLYSPFAEFRMAGQKRRLRRAAIRGKDFCNDPVKQVGQVFSRKDWSAEDFFCGVPGATRKLFDLKADQNTKIKFQSRSVGSFPFLYLGIQKRFVICCAIPIYFLLIQFPYWTCFGCTSIGSNLMIRTPEKLIAGSPKTAFCFERIRSG
jgi:hypothetical protein